jgi:hypothetical protein
MDIGIGTYDICSLVAGRKLTGYSAIKSPVGMKTKKTMKLHSKL